MADATSSAYLDGRVVTGGLSVRGHRDVLLAFLWIFASLCTAVAILAIVFAVSAQKQREAGRMIVESQKGTGYLSVVAQAMAAGRGRPNGI